MWLAPLASLDSLSVVNIQKSLIGEEQKCDTTFSEIKKPLNFEAIEISYRALALGKHLYTDAANLN